ncbi:Transferase [Macleaya cordata]|uniref:Transferase n=1 Tax=Macleaya cordata TaxID=56857 RepID=A0A200Q3P5_MACCD|nr:Transferase [Macleaya cordata]
MTIKVTVRESMLVQPAEKTPKLSLWTSNVDQLFRMHMPSVYFYKPTNGYSDFFDSSVLKDGLSKALVSFYPFAGRLRRDEKDGRVEIDCTGEGVMFSEAETDSVLDELGDFIPNQQLQPLIPKVDTSKDISSVPILLIQVTRFKCGGVCLGVAMDHTVADGASGIHFINTWADLSRGIDIKFPPFIDRTLLRARDPPTPCFPHIEHQPPPSMKNALQPLQTPLKPNKTTPDNSPAIAKLQISYHQINLLKAKCNEGSDQPVRFSTYEVIAGHVWRCACKARGLQDDQETKLSIATDGRLRLNPPLPNGYLGNAIFHLTPMAVSGDLLSRPLSYAASKIRDTLMRGDDEYCKSAIDFLDLHPDIRTLVRGPHTFKCPNLGVTSWCRMPIHEVDFGWGKPIYMGPGAILYEGLCYILPSPGNDGTLTLVISLQSDHMELYKEYFYDI